MTTLTASDLVERLQAQLVAGDPATRISGLAALADAEPGDLSFFYDARYKQDLARTKASVILVPLGWSELPEGTTCVAVKNPSESFGKLADEFAPQRPPFQAGIHPSAVVGENVVANRDRICVGANVVIEDGAHIGDETEIGPGCFVGRDVRIGAGCRFLANVTVHERCILGDRVILHSGVVIGTDGFGYAFKAGRHQKIAQNGIVQIDSDVEIGAGSMVDRARIGRTRIGEGTKIDNLVQIGHNVVVGKHCIIVAQSGIAGSSVVGDYVVIAAQAGVVDHMHIGSQCTIGARAVVSRDLPPGRVNYLGFPATPAGEELKRMAAARQLPLLVSRIRELEKKLQKEEGQV
jgi:UDP-3-O-[3-hydroxymyristoyl] glucosamine N-acyltransferase